MELSIFFLGTAASVPSARRGLSATLIQRGAEKILVDCGEGTQRQLVRSVGLVDIDDIFITHLHTDHWLGLPGMIRSFELRGRQKPLTIYGPPGLAHTFAMLKPVYGTPSFALDIVELEADEILDYDAFEIEAYPVRHRGVAFGYILREHTRRGRFDVEQARRFGIEPGPDFGRLERGETVRGVRPEQVIAPDRLGRKIVLSGDTAPTDTTVVAAYEADVLIHEATFARADQERAQKTYHSTAEQAAQVAVDAQVHFLALTHISSRYIGRELCQEAQAVFPTTVIARDFDKIVVPYREEAKPSIIGWRERASV